MRVILIGNAPLRENISSLIQKDDYIVRFNMVQSPSLHLTGMQTNALFLANTDYLAQKNIQSGLLESPVFMNQPKILLPYDQEIISRNFPYYKVKLWHFIKYKKSNYNTQWLIEQLKSTTCEIEILSSNHYQRCLDLLDIEDIHIFKRPIKKAYIPSTGFIALNYYLSHPDFATYPIIMHGFSCIGWDGHAWNKERDVLLSLKQEGKVSFLDNTMLK